MANDAQPNLYAYEPSTAAPAVFIVLFLLSALTHAFQCWRAKAIYAIAPVPACIIMSVGLAIRIVSAKSPNNLGLYIASECVIFVSIPVFACGIALVTSRTLSYVPLLYRYVQPFTPVNLAATFLAIALLVAVFSASGSSLCTVNYIGKDYERPNYVGQGFLRSALFIQLLLLILLLYVAIRLHQHSRERKLARRWYPALYSIYLSSLFIFIRCIFRLVEAITGWENPNGDKRSKLDRNEAYILGLDYAMMLAATVTLNVLHASRFLPQDKAKKLLRNGREGTKNESARGRANASASYPLTHPANPRVPAAVHKN